MLIPSMESGNSEPQEPPIVTCLNPEFDAGVETTTGYEIDVPEEVIEVAQKIKDLGGRALIVGGAVRDAILSAEHDDFDLEPKDFDIEVSGIEEADLVRFLQDTYTERRVHLTGEGFNVYKVYIPGFIEPLDFSLPRTEEKVAEGHKGFRIVGSPRLTLKEAAKRRDIVPNTAAYDPLTKTVYDPYGAVEAIKNRVIEVTDPKSFVDDPLRVLRVMQFAPRFNFDVSGNTMRLATEMVASGEMDTLPAERLSDEFRKMLIKARRPSIGLEFAQAVGYTRRFLPELSALEGVPQQPEWHPEGPVWEHTLQVLDAAAEIYDRELAEGRIPPRPDLEILKKRTEQYFEEELYRAQTGQYLQLLKESGKEDEVADIESKASAAYKKRFKRHYAQHSVRMMRKPENKRKIRMKSLEGEARWVAEEAAEKVRSTTVRSYIEKLLQDGSLDLSAVEAANAVAEGIAKKLREDYWRLSYKNAIEEARLTLLFAAICHDFGKPEKTVINPETKKITSKQHETAGVVPTKEFLKRFANAKVPQRVKDAVVALVPEHMNPYMLWKVRDDVKKPEKAVSNLAARLHRGRTHIYYLSLLVEADQRGRNGDSDEPKSREDIPDLAEMQEWLWKSARELDIFDRPPLSAHRTAESKIIDGDELARRIELQPAGRKGGNIELGVIIKAVRAHHERLGVPFEEVNRQEALDYAVSLWPKFKEFVQRRSNAPSTPEVEVWSDLKDMSDPADALAN